jgi:MtN3 and saliva related transmembrane protein
MTSVIGLMAAFFTTIAYIPQTIKVLKTKDTKSISLGMYCLITIGIGLWLVYGILIGDINIILANAICFTLSSIILAMKLRFG